MRTKYEIRHEQVSPCPRAQDIEPLGSFMYGGYLYTRAKQGSGVYCEVSQSLILAYKHATAEVVGFVKDTQVTPNDVILTSSLARE